MKASHGCGVTLRGGATVRAVLTVAVLTVAVLTVAVLTVAALAAGSGLASSQAPASAAAAPGPAAVVSQRTITLINGDRVVVSRSGGVQSDAVAPAGGGVNQALLRLDLGGQVYEIPADAVPYLGRGYHRVRHRDGPGVSDGFVGGCVRRGAGPADGG